MSRMVNLTLQDLRGGRHSWRVLLALSLPSFFAGFAAGLL